MPCRGFDCGSTKRWKVWKDFKEIAFNEELMGHIEESEVIYLYRIIK